MAASGWWVSEPGEEVFLFTAASGMGGGQGIDELLGVCIFSLHPVITFFDLNSPGGKISGQNRFETDIESQIWVEVGLELGFKFSL